MSIIASIWLLHILLNVHLSQSTVNRPILDSKPNILIFFVDDLEFTTDWNHSSPAGTQLDGTTIEYFDINTPNIQSIIDEGIIFSRSYAGGSKCSPSRFSLLTGRYPVRSEYAIEQTSQSRSIPPYAGTRVEVPFSKIYGSNDNGNNLQTVLQKNGYATGFTGKWHLMSSDDNGNNVGCANLDTTPNADLYETCRNIVAQQGFDMVDAYFDGNIGANEYFSHNPEWMVDISQKFIHNAIHEEQKPFFLYFSPTLKHTSVNIIDALQQFTNKDTPKGTLEGENIPSDTGMKTRQKIYSEARQSGYSGRKNIERVAGTIWVDDALGALINYLKTEGLYDNTFIVLYNDHGMGAKATLFEQGGRMFQYIRFPPYWNSAEMELPYYLPKHFITSNVDLSAVIYDMLQITDTEIDGKSWIDDAFSIINDDNAVISCCDKRYIDMFNSHAIVDEKWKYIFRATDEIGTNTRFYACAADEEQLYDMSADPNEQNNVINDAALQDVVSNFRQLMDDYIQNVACFTEECKSPLTKCIKYQTMCSAEENCFEGDEYLGTSEACGSGSSGRYRFDCEFCQNKENKLKTEI